MTSALHLSRTKISALESEIRDLRLWSEEQSHLFEAELEALKKESSNYKKESHGLRQDISVLQKQLEEKEAALSALQNQFGSLQQSYSSLQSASAANTLGSIKEEMNLRKIVGQLQHVREQLEA